MTRAELSNLFEPDSIRDNLSYTKLLALGNVEGLAIAMRTNLKSGISDGDTDLREDHFGRNDPVFALQKTLWDMVLECFDDLMLQVLCIATVVSTVIGILQEGIDKGW